MCMYVQEVYLVQKATRLMKPLSAKYELTPKLYIPNMKGKGYLSEAVQNWLSPKAPTNDCLAWGDLQTRYGQNLTSHLQLVNFELI